MTAPQSTPIVPVGSLFPRITWMRDVAEDPRLSPEVRDLAIVMGYSADRFGRCNLTVRQIQGRLVTRAKDGGYIPERTIKSWRTKLKKLGVMVDPPGANGQGFGGPGKGRGGVWQLLENGQGSCPLYHHSY
jgi:hypothetical protein